MKPCTYCGRENADDAVCCRECGTEFVRPSEPPLPEPKRPEFVFAELSEADKQKDLVTVVTCATLIAADMVASRLRASGIEPFIPDQCLMQAIGWNLNTYGYVRVQIAPKDYDAARDLLSELEEDD